MNVFQQWCCTVHHQTERNSFRGRLGFLTKGGTQEVEIQIVNITVIEGLVKQRGRLSL